MQDLPNLQQMVFSTVLGVALLVLVNLLRKLLFEGFIARAIPETPEQRWERLKKAAWARGRELVYFLAGAASSVFSPEIRAILGLEG
ncbi:hypothetical protein KUW17_16855 [Leisingera aquaemixtae]|uniref:hypothetical protein n=1 Tax=Leisingera aquaemixtae TaxID=1396826 RepID=UPI001C93A5B4|nr:hypothetical protein [Leisingera aquaemixtae]MBY6068420.1 hypothetical protein [Leisingera aquaemixtae]